MLLQVPSLFRKPFGFYIAWLMIGTLSAIRSTGTTNFTNCKRTVIDKASEKPLAGVSVTVAGLSVGVTTDSTGNFTLVNVPVGRQRISFTSIGYKPVSIPEVLVTIGKQVVLDVSLEESIRTLNEVSVTAPRARKV